MATKLPEDLLLTPISGKPRTLRQQLTTFHLLMAVMDPYSRYSRMLLPTADRVLANFDEADVRTAWLVAAGAADTRRFLSQVTPRLTFVDDDRTVVGALNVPRLPALVHIGISGEVENVAVGWNPTEWEGLTDNLARLMSWSGPTLPGPFDPAPFEGSPAA